MSLASEVRRWPAHGDDDVAARRPAFRSGGLKATQHAMHISGRLPADVVEAGREPSLRRLTPAVPQLKKEIPVGIALAGMAEPREIWFVLDLVQADALVRRAERIPVSLQLVGGEFVV
jgi:hypothetical protein